jgi:hypothetical protein
VLGLPISLQLGSYFEDTNWISSRYSQNNHDAMA